MIKCKNKDCDKNICCVECNITTEGCCCEIAEELEYDKASILEKCEDAEYIVIDIM